MRLLTDHHRLTRSFQSQPFRVLDDEPWKRPGRAEPEPVAAELAERMAEAGLIEGTRGAAPWPGRHDGYVLDYRLSSMGARLRPLYL